MKTSYKKWWYNESNDEMVFSGYHSNEIAVKWASKKELIIYCQGRVDYLVENYWGIKITFKNLNNVPSKTLKRRLNGT